MTGAAGPARSSRFAPPRGVLCVVLACLLGACTAAGPADPGSSTGRDACRSPAGAAAGAAADCGQAAAPTGQGGGEALAPAPEAANGYRRGLRTAFARRLMAVAPNPLASEAGRRILERGGSAIDAAIAMQAVLTLTDPQSSGIGGGAFIVYWDGRRVQTYDGRETAPMGATGRLFLHADGSPMRFDEARIGGRSVGVPGVLRALQLAHRQHGRMAWSRLFEPAIGLARRGFPISPRLAHQIAVDRFLPSSPAMAAYFLQPDGTPKPAGTLLRNPALADTLRAIAQRGPQALYRGPIAQAIVQAVQHSANPGTLSLDDLQRYEARERAPLCTDYRRWRLCGMGPPTSGGIAVAQVLGILGALERQDPTRAIARFRPRPVNDAARLAPDPEAVHLIAEAERLAYADRAQYVADTDFVPLDVAGLLDPGYLASRARLIGERSMGKAAPGRPPGQSLTWAADRSPLRISTSQIVAVDARGQAVSMTTTVESYFGSHLMVHGFMLNNQLTDFSFEPARDGRPIANRVEPGKRPRSAMAPTLVFDRGSGQLLAAVGSPGGSQIIEYVVKTLIGLLDWRLDPQDAVDLPNFGSRNGPTELERRFLTPALIDALRARGHTLSALDMTSGVQLIQRARRDDLDLWAGAADPRSEGEALGR